MKKFAVIPGLPGLNKDLHPWSFLKIGGFNQVQIENGEDLKHLGELDQKLWSALSCPTKGLEFDDATLNFLDTDKDGRIRVNEVCAAVDWVCRCLKDPGVIIAGSDALRLAALDDTKPEGARLLASAKHILVCLGKADADSISLADSLNTVGIFGESEFNGDGVLPPGAAGDEATGAIVSEIMACVGDVPDRSGKTGVDQAKVDLFFDNAVALTDWASKPEGDPSILVLGDATVDACGKFAAVRAKIDDYFARCRLAAFDKRSIAALNREEKDYLVIAAKDLTITDAEIAALPLSVIEAGRALPLADGLNPAWIQKITAFRNDVVVPLQGAAGANSITQAQWESIAGKFAAYEAWMAAKPATEFIGALEALGVDRLGQLVGGDSRQRITALIAQDKAVEAEAVAIAEVEKLLRYNKYLYRLLNNFVSFREFYMRREKAVFQAGTLYLDNRSCDLCIRVHDMGRHLMMAGSSRMYLVYCDCRRPSGETMTIAAAVTGGDSDDLIVGRNGVFYDRQNRDWDATIVKIIENPISVRQAFWSPYKRLQRFIEEQVAKRAAAGDAESTKKLQTAATDTQAVAGGAKPPEAKSKFDIGVVAALGVAVGGLTAAFGVIMQAFFGLGIWLPLGLVGVLLLISGPSMFIASLKLRQRNLGPLLDANGWAINAKAKVNLVFGAGLTGVATLPPGSTCGMTDPYAAKKRVVWPWIVLAVLIAAALVVWSKGFVNDYLPLNLQCSPTPKVEVVAAPAPAPAPAPATK
jgi:hypothetical protein